MPTSTRGPVTTAERALAPDLARGLMLLLIVLSNAAFFLWSADYDGQYPAPTGPADSAVQFLQILVLDVRVYPLFAFLFGYGMTQLYRRQIAAGASERDATALLRRRSGWLLVFGFAHAALLLPSDVLGSYGVISFFLGWLFLRRTDKTLLTWSAVGTTLLALLLISGVVLAISTSGAPAESAPSSAAISGTGEENYLLAAVMRLAMWTVLVLLNTFGITAPVAMLLGIWAARRRILEEPHRHLPLLRRIAITGIALGWLGSLPAALDRIDVLPPVNELALMGMQWPTGLAGGIGYVALFGLLASRISPKAVVAISAVGKRSLSSYLTHSLLLGPVLAAWGLGLGAHLTSATMAAYAVGAWLVTVAAAHWLERRGIRGPAETALRRLVYRRPQ
ncbi:Uncharacterized membrane protein YeiB [Saccharopolyspora antimicrobica]|uniref:Membrane protein YeiB n=1 Tax=Saccharopolyspora antimicrobica TaxID=455193 RepID=A0A1I4XLR2_9PSEU|nr:DUF418 domain-containing protein [Saccharopolyspora antimicrobica]RKT84564.1 putative membrane protein YeiB [Saccharopolyspora antimicrobica]SFN26767.1 Uncharacterized membrane protein YeiB [Saccharopolyspora antimicrobica]